MDILIESPWCEKLNERMHTNPYLIAWHTEESEEDKCLWKGEDKILVEQKASRHFRKVGPYSSYRKLLEVLALSCSSWNLQCQAWALYTVGTQEIFLRLNEASARPRFGWRDVCRKGRKAGEREKDREAGMRQLAGMKDTGDKAWTREIPDDKL